MPDDQQSHVPDLESFLQDLYGRLETLEAQSPALGLFQDDFLNLITPVTNPTTPTAPTTVFALGFNKEIGVAWQLAKPVGGRTFGVEVRRSDSATMSNDVSLGEFQGYLLIDDDNKRKWGASITRYYQVRTVGRSGEATYFSNWTPATPVSGTTLAAGSSNADLQTRMDTFAANVQALHLFPGALSVELSPLSQAISVLSQQVSVLSQKVSVLSSLPAASVTSTEVSAVSAQAASALSQALSVVSVAIAVETSNRISAVSGLSIVGSLLISGLPTQLFIKSGAIATRSHVQMGRIAAEVDIAVVGSPGEFFTSSLAGDLILRNFTTDRIRMGVLRVKGLGIGTDTSNVFDMLGPGGPAFLTFRSGDAAGRLDIVIGRVGTDGHFGVIGSAGEFFSSGVAGDMFFRVDGGTLWFGSSSGGGDATFGIAADGRITFKTPVTISGTLSAPIIDTLSNAISVLSQAVSVVSVAASNALSVANAASNAASVVSVAINVVSNALSNELSVRAAAINTVSNAISVVSQALSVETANRVSAISGLSVITGGLGISGGLSVGGVGAIGGAALTSTAFTIRGAGATAATWAVRVLNSAAAELLAVQNDGNVGIGTAGPGAPLHVSRASDGRVLQLTRANVAEWIFSIGNIPALSGVASGGSLEIIPLNANTDLAIAANNGSVVGTIFKNDGNVGIGTTTPPTGGGPALALGVGANPTGIGADKAGIFAKDVAASGELFAFDEAGNFPQLSPHPGDFLATRPIATSGPYAYPWAYTAMNIYLGKRITVDMAGVVAEIERLSGKVFTSMEILPSKASWTADQAAIRLRREEEIAAAQQQISDLDALIAVEPDLEKKAALQTSRDAIQIPPIYQVKLIPQWLRDRGAA